MCSLLAAGRQVRDPANWGCAGDRGSHILSLRCLTSLSYSFHRKKPAHRYRTLDPQVRFVRCLTSLSYLSIAGSLNTVASATKDTASCCRRIGCGLAMALNFRLRHRAGKFGGVFLLTQPISYRQQASKSVVITIAVTLVLSDSQCRAESNSPWRGAWWRLTYQYTVGCEGLTPTRFGRKRQSVITRSERTIINELRQTDIQRHC